MKRPIEKMTTDISHANEAEDAREGTFSLAVNYAVWVSHNFRANVRRNYEAVIVFCVHYIFT